MTAVEHQEQQFFTTYQPGVSERRSDFGASLYHSVYQPLGRKMFRPGAGSGPRSNQYGETGVTKRQTEGVVTANHDIHPQLPRQRAQNEAGHDAHTRLGNVGEAYNPTLHTDELLFYRRSSRRWVGDNPVTHQGASTEVFSGWNGEGIEPKVKTQEQFTSGYGFAGRAKGKHDFTDIGVANEGVASQIRGACSIANVAEANNEWFYGDLLEYVLPNIDPSRRAEEQSRLHRPINLAPTKLVARLVPKHYEDVHRIGERGISAYLVETTDNPDHPTWDPARLRTLPNASTADMFTRERMRKTLFDALAGFAVFSRYFGMDVDGKLAITPQPLSRVQETHLSNQIRAFAAFLGLAHNVPGASEELRAFEDSRLSRLGGGHAHREVFLLANRGQIVHQKLYNLMRLFDPATVMPDSDEAHLEAALTSMAVTDQQTYAMMMDISNERVVGRCIKSYVGPGEWGDVDLSP